MGLNFMDEEENCMGNEEVNADEDAAHAEWVRQEESKNLDG